MNVSVAPLRNASGRVVSAVVVVADVTDHRRRAELAARQSSESTLRVGGTTAALVANISDVISVIDAEGGLRYSSPSVERVYGYKEGAWPEGQSIFDTVHPDDRDRVFELWEGSLSTPGEFRPLEIRLRKGDGSWMYTEVIANNLLDDPSVNGIVVTSRDITQRKQSRRGGAGERRTAARERGALSRRRRRSDRVGVPLSPRRDADVREPRVRRVLRVDERRARRREAGRPATGVGARAHVRVAERVRIG